MTWADPQRGREAVKRLRIERALKGLCEQCESAATHGDFCQTHHERRCELRRCRYIPKRPPHTAQAPSEPDPRGEQWLAMWNEGRSLTAIARASGSYPKAVRLELERRGVAVVARPAPPGRAPRLDPRGERWLDLWNQGLPLSAIARDAATFPEIVRVQLVRRGVVVVRRLWAQPKPRAKQKAA